MATRDVSSLLLQIDASSELLRKELNKAGLSVESFTKKSEAELKAFDKQLADVASSVKSRFGREGRPAAG